MQPWALILMALFCAAALVPVARVRAAHRRRLASLAMGRGWTYTPGDPWDLPAEMEAFWLGTWGHDRCCRDVVSVPTQIGSLWLAQFARRMSSGRYRHTQRYALAMVRANVTCGGIAILPTDEMFVATEPFHRYRPVDIPETPQGCRIWAERATSERLVIAALANLRGELPGMAAIEVRGHTAIAYWPVTGVLDEQTLARLELAGRRLIEVLSSPACRGSL